MAGFDFDELDVEDQKAAPIFVGWYSGGYHKEKGEEMLKTVMDGVSKAHPLVDTLVLHFPNEYGMTAEGTDPWPAYVDTLVDEIDKEPSRRGRPLFLFGHSRGATPAMSLAARLGSRVLKVYVAASDAPVVGEVSPFQQMSQQFKEAGDLGLLEWFVSLNPNKMMVEIFENVKSGQMKIEDNRFVNDMLSLMRVQYKDAMYPDMQRDFAGVCSPVFAFRPELDATCTRLGTERWKEWTSAAGKSRSKTVVRATHMGCLGAQVVDGQEEFLMIDEITKDMGKMMSEI